MVDFTIEKRVWNIPLDSSNFSADLQGLKARDGGIMTD